MGCVAGEQLSAYLDGELDAKAAVAVARHLESCPGCRRDLESLQATVALLRLLPSHRAPAGLAAAVRERGGWPPSPAASPGEAAQTRRQGGPGAKRTLRAARLALAATVAAAAGFLGVGLHGGESDAGIFVDDHLRYEALTGITALEAAPLAQAGDPAREPRRSVALLEPGQQRQGGGALVTPAAATGAGPAPAGLLMVKVGDEWLLLPPEPWPEF